MSKKNKIIRIIFIKIIILLNIIVESVDSIPLLFIWCFNLIISIIDDIKD